ncbi:MAG: SprT-like domain-containing protein [Gemmatimonadales bacterium]
MRSQRALAEEAARDADEVLLVRRLRQLGVRRPIKVHENRAVLVSLSRRGVLRVHRGYAYGGDRILQAIVSFVNPRCRGLDRNRARRVIVEFPVDSFVRPIPRVRPRTGSNVGDRPLLKELSRIHAAFNAMYFGGQLSAIRFRISNRMRTKLGELSMDARGERPTEIAISRYHLERDGWDEVKHTVLHEMIHQFQAEKQLTVDHGMDFRALARRVGVEPRANRLVTSGRGKFKRTD